MNILKKFEHTAKTIDFLFKRDHGNATRIAAHKKQEKKLFDDLNSYIIATERHGELFKSMAKATLITGGALALGGIGVDALALQVSGLASTVAGVGADLSSASKAVDTLLSGASGAAGIGVASYLAGEITDNKQHKAGRIRDAVEANRRAREERELSPTATAMKSMRP